MIPTTKQELLDRLKELSGMIADAVFNPSIHEKIGKIQSMIEHLPEEEVKP